MATTQQLLDLKYGRQLLEDRAYLSELFSEDLLGEMFRQQRTTLQQILETTNLNIAYQGNSYIATKGINLLSSLTELTASNTFEGNVSLSSLSNLVYLTLKYCYNLTSIGSCYNLRKLREINIAYTSISNFGTLRNSSELQYFIANDSLLENAEVNYTSLLIMNLNNNKFNTARVDLALREARSGKAAGSPLTSLNLGGQNMAIPTGGEANYDYIWLVSSGVTVTIRTS